jgi:sugar transferase (PEP-CTERM/EpsH1 system associated)
MKRIKVGYVVASLGYGGVEKYIVDLVNGVDRNRFEPVIFCLQGNGPLKGLIRQQVKIYVLAKRQGNDPILMVKLGKLFRNEKVDIIHSNNWSTFFESAMARMLAPSSVLLHTQHGMEMNGSEAFCRRTRYIRNRIRQSLTYVANRVLVVSAATEQFVCNEWYTPLEKITLIYNGVDLNKFKDRKAQRSEWRNKLGLKQKDMVIGSVGRLSPVKNYSLLIRAFHDVARHDLNVKLMIVGDGSEKESLLSLIRELELQNRVLLLGHRSDVSELLCAMDIFVLSSISEGVSLALLEAMATALPAVATNVGGNPEVLGGKDCGLLVASNDRPALTKALTYLNDHPTERLNLGRQARLRIQSSFDLKRMVCEYESVYRTCLNSTRDD